MTDDYPSKEKRARIGVDASFLQLPPSGIGTYTKELLHHLPEVAPDLELVQLTPGWRSNSTLLPKRDRAGWDIGGVSRAAAANKIDLLHIPQFTAPVWSRRPFVVTLHDVIPYDWPQYRQSRSMNAYLHLMRRTTSRAMQFIVPSRYVAERAQCRLGIPDDLIRVIPMGVNSSFQPASNEESAQRKPSSLGINGRYIFNIGGFDLRKNLPMLVESFAELKRSPEFADVQLVIGGHPHSENTEIFPPLPPLIDQYDLGNAVILTGRVDFATRLALYQSARLYVTPSLDEGSGLTVLEAMATGVPVIAANRGALPETAGGAALLIEPTRQKLAQAMASLLRDEHEWESLRQRGLLRASEFSWSRTASDTVNVYRSVLTQSETRSR